MAGLSVWIRVAGAAGKVGSDRYCKKIISGIWGLTNLGVIKGNNEI